MGKDKAIGALLFLGGILGIVAYAWLVFLSEWAMITLQLTGFVAVAAVLAIVSWIGYTLATTPPPKPIEEIERELEKELKEGSEAEGAESKPEPVSASEQGSGSESESKSKSKSKSKPKPKPKSKEE
jgi:predicted DNA-binding transcriptional regulator